MLLMVVAYNLKKLLKHRPNPYWRSIGASVGNAGARKHQLGPSRSR